MAEIRGRLVWRIGEVVETRPETPRVKSLFLEVPQRSYSIASAPEDGRLALVVERLEDGEVSPYLSDELRVGDGLKLRGPIGGWFTWETKEGGPLLLVGGGSVIAPLMAMIRHRTAPGATHRPASSTPRARAKIRSTPGSSNASRRRMGRWR